MSRLADATCALDAVNDCGAALKRARDLHAETMESGSILDAVVFADVALSVACHARIVGLYAPGTAAAEAAARDVATAERLFDEINERIMLQCGGDLRTLVASPRSV